MAISPGIYNFTIQKRSDHKERFQFCDNANISHNLTGWNVQAQAWTLDRKTKLFDFNVNTSELSQGIITLFVPRAQTVNLPHQFEYDIALVNPSNVKEYYIAGSIFTSEGYTE